MRSTEQEFKTLLTADQAAAVLTAYAFEPPFHQTNVYYDTTQRTLADRSIGLRVRLFSDHAEQTLKIASGPARRLTEITDPLTVATATALTQAGAIRPGGAVAATLAEEGIAVDAVHPIGQATTTRRLAPQSAGLLTLDHTRYPNGAADWELELEYGDQPAAQAFWVGLKRQFGIATRPVENKIARALANATSREQNN